MSGTELYQLYEVPADGSARLLQPPMEARSMAIYNQSSERVTVTAAAGSVLSADPGTTLAQPIQAGIVWTVRADAAFTGSAWVDFSDQRRAFVFGVPNRTPKADPLSLNNSTGTVTLVRASSQLVLQLVTLTTAGLLNVTATKAGSTVSLLTNLRIGGSSYAIVPWKLPIDLPAGAVVSVSYTGHAAFYLGY